MPVKPQAKQWWRTPLIPILGRQRLNLERATLMVHKSLTSECFTPTPGILANNSMGNPFKYT